MNALSRSLRERAPLSRRRAFAASPNRKLPGSGTGAKSHPAVACKYFFPFVSFCALYLFLYVFDPVNPFQCFVCSWGCFSLRVPVPACRLSFITLHSVLKPSLNFSCTTRSKTKTVLALCEMNSPLFVPLLFFFLHVKRKPLLFQLICVSVSLHFGVSEATYQCLPDGSGGVDTAAVPNGGKRALELLTSLRWDCCFVFLFCSLKIEGWKWRGRLGKVSTPQKKKYWPIFGVCVGLVLFLHAPILET